MYQRGLINLLLIIGISVVAVSAFGFVSYQIYLHDVATEDQCLTVLDNNYILEDRYSCNTQEFTAFSFNLAGSDAEGARVLLKNNDGSQEEIELKDGSRYDNVRTLTSNFGDTIDVNEEGQKVIVVEGRYDSIEVHPLIDSSVCGIGDSYFFGNCDSETEGDVEISSGITILQPPTNNTNVSTTRSRSGGGGSHNGGGDDDDSDPPIVPACGDGAINQASETCDDGNTLDEDGCSAICAFTGNISITSPIGGSIYGSNFHLPIRFNIFNTSEVNSCWFNLKDSEGLEVDNGTLNCVNSLSNPAGYFTTTGDGMFKLNVFVNTTNDLLSGIVNFEVAESSPSLSVTSPLVSETTYSSNPSVNFTYSTYHPLGIGQCALFIDTHYLVGPPTIIHNQTNNPPANNLSEINVFSAELPEGSHDWAISCISTAQGAIAVRGGTIVIDTTSPNITINEPFSRPPYYGFTNDIPLNFSIDEANLNINSCSYSVSSSSGNSGGAGSGNIINCQSPIFFDFAANSGQTNYSLTVIASDLAGNIANQTVLFGTQLFPPAASFNIDPESGITPLTVNFDASTSHDQDGDIERYDWVYGDGSTCENCSEIVNHTFNDAGIYLVNLTVTDDVGLDDSITHTIEVTQSTGPDPFCGDGIINQANESCDGDDFGVYGNGMSQCNLYDSQYQSGNLGCVPGECTISVTECSTEQANCISPVDGWIRQAFVAQANTFTITYDDTPTEDSNDGNIAGLSLGEGNDFSDYAVAVRFSNGNVDARNGGIYSATNTVPYILGTTYHVRLEVNVAAKIYDVYITPEGGSEVQLANDFGFRTGQDNVGYLDNFGVFSGGGGTSAADHSVCNFVMTPAQPVCGNGIVETDEDCDDGDQNPGDGCSASCTVESNYSCSGFPLSTCVEVTQCNDNIDNDGDGYKDNFDFSCQQGGENEDTFLAECQDGIDNADPEDTLIDSNDPGCYSTQDNDETNALAGTILEPGDGWTSLLTQPAAIGDPSDERYTAKAIAQWDVVPFQDFNTTFNIGIVAFHIAGIDRVEFSVDNGHWVAVDEMTLNPRTGVYEYWATLNASLFNEDGPVEVRAIVYPNIGEPRVLQGADHQVFNSEVSLFLTSNGQGTLPSLDVYVSTIGDDSVGDGSQGNPFRTIERAQTYINSQQGELGGATIYLSEGDYAAPGGSYEASRYFVITRAPGTNKANVRLTSGRLTSDIKKVKFEDITIAPQTNSAILETDSQIRPFAWVDNSDVYGTGRGHSESVFNKYMMYVTDTTWKDTVNAQEGARLIRNLSIKDIVSDAFSNSYLVINSKVDGIDASGTDAHPDLYQLARVSNPADVDNNILYNIEAVNSDAQGLFFPAGGNLGHTVNNVAFVNILIEKGNPSNYLNQWSAPSNHVLIWHNTYIDLWWTWRGSTADYTNFDFRNNLFRAMHIDGDVSVTDLVQSINLKDNHFVDDRSFSTPSEFYNTPGSTTGDITWEDAPNDYFKPVEGSITEDRGQRVVPNDLDNNPRSDPSDIGAYESSPPLSPPPEGPLGDTGSSKITLVELVNHAIYKIKTLFTGYAIKDDDGSAFITGNAVNDNENSSARTGIAIILFLIISLLITSSVLNFKNKRRTQLIHKLR